MATPRPGSRRTAAGQGIERIIVSPYTRALQTARPVAAALGLPVTIDPIVRERYAFACDIGSPRPALERDWPNHDFSAIEDIWWPDQEEPEESIVDRAARFRADLAARHDWANTLVVSHWGFILSLTGQSVANGQWLRCDPTEPAPQPGLARLNPAPRVTTMPESRLPCPPSRA